MSTSTSRDIRWHEGIAEIPRDKWDRLALAHESPFLEWHWLHQMEASGSISPTNGWHPRHLTLWDGHALIAAAPLYLKTHSEGEFVFDHFMAQFAQQQGLTYYPKLVGMSPATPVPGYRFLMAPHVDGAEIFQILLRAIQDFCIQNGCSGFQMNHMDPDWLTGTPPGFSAWDHQCFQWRNRNYRHFNDYLNVFRSKQRHNIRRERRRMQSLGIDMVIHTGDDIAPQMAAVMFEYYLKTNAQFGPWAARYFNAGFFEGVFSHFRHRLVIAAAYKGSDRHFPLALSMLVRKGDRIYGRYWGCAEQIKDLHFNLCYYHPIEWAIASGIELFDPGMGSQHKVYRGFESAITSSMHRYFDPRLQIIFDHVVKQLNLETRKQVRLLNRKLPFASTGVFQASSPIAGKEP